MSDPDCNDETDRLRSKLRHVTTALAERIKEVDQLRQQLAAVTAEKERAEYLLSGKTFDLSAVMAEQNRQWSTVSLSEAAANLVEVLKNERDDLREQLAAVTAAQDNWQMCHETQRKEILRLTDDLATARAACAEIREVLLDRPALLMPTNHLQWLERESHALSSSCGHGFVPVSELEPMPSLLDSAIQELIRLTPESSYNLVYNLRNERDRLTALKEGLK